MMRPETQRGLSTGQELDGFVSSGCSATVALVTDKKIYVSNIGNCRTLLAVNNKALDLSMEHKPTNSQEE